MLKIKRYGEYGCPFNGLMFDMTKEEIKKTHYIKRFVQQNMDHLRSKVRNFNTKKIKKKRVIIIPKIKRLYEKSFVIDCSNSLIVIFFFEKDNPNAKG